MPQRLPLSSCFPSPAAVTLALCLALPSLPADAATAKTSATASAGAKATASAKANDDARTRQRILDGTGPRADIDYDLEAAKKRDEQISQLQKIIPRVQGEPRADLLFRLAELWWEKSRIEARTGILRYDEAMSAWIDGGEKAGAPEPRLSDFLKESELFRFEALRTYRDVLDNHPGYARRDEVLFADAYNKAELGRREEAIAGYVELLRAFPRSRFAGDAQVQLGEHYFEGNELGKARAAYEQALSSPNASLRSFARYRLAWCDYNAGDDAAAIEKLKEVVAQARGGQGTAGQRNEALSDMVPGFARLGAVDEALAYFQSEVGGSAAGDREARRLIARLAAMLLEAGHPQAARKAYGQLIASAPNDPKNPAYQRAIIDAFESERERGRVQEELRHLAHAYGPKSDWARANAGDEAALKEAYEIAEAAMRTLVTDYHQEAQRTKSVATYRLARDIYGDYLALFADSQQAGELRFFYAEILWALGEFEGAGPQYLAVARQQAATGTAGELERAAAYNAMLSFEKLVDIERGRARKVALGEGQRVDEKRRKADLRRGDRAALLKAGAKSSELDEAVALTGAETSLVEAIDAFVGRFPSDAEAIAARYKAAFLFFERRHEVEAARRLGDIIATAPTDRWSRKAAELSLNLLERREAWLELSELSRSLAANSALVGSDKAFGARLTRIGEASLYKHLDETVLGERGDKAAAAQGFADFANAHPQSTYAPQALFYALTLRAELGELDLAIALGQSLLTRHPDAARADGSSLVAETWRRLSKLFERVADIERAAEAADNFIAIALPAFRARAGDANANNRRASAATATPDASSAAAATTARDSEAQALGDALLDAALYRDGLGSTDLANLDRALTHAETFLDLFPARDEAPAMALKVAALHRDILRMPAMLLRHPVNRGRVESPQKRREQAIAALTRAREKFGDRLTEAQRFAAQADALWLRVQSDTGARGTFQKEIDALKAAHEVLSAEAKADAGVRDAMAAVRFAVLEHEWKRFEAIDFTDLNLRRLRAAMADKVRRLESLERDYLAVIALTSERWTLAALTRLGLVYRDFAQKLLDSPDPPELSADELDLYRAELENQAFPLEEKAIQALETAIAKAFELTRYDEWLIAAEEALETLRPGTWPAQRRSHVVASPPGPWREVSWQAPERTTASEETAKATGVVTTTAEGTTASATTTAEAATQAAPSKMIEATSAKTRQTTARTATDATAPATQGGEP